MASLAQINDTQVSIINFKSIPVVTTEMLADFYGTDVNNIKVNLSRNKERFVEGKHFFKIAGQELKDFANDLKSLANDLWVTKSNSQNLQPSQRGVQISPKTRVLTLWTERGAARHAKMLDTDQAWEVFEQLEDCYFIRKEILAKTHKSERTALHEAHALLVAKTKHLNSSDAWKLINQRFGTKGIDEIPYDVIPVAVEYVHHLIALYSNADKQVFTSADLQNLHALATHMIWAQAWWRTFGDAIRAISPTMASAVHCHFVDGSSVAWRYIDKSKHDELREAVKDYEWLLPYNERRRHIQPYNS